MEEIEVTWISNIKLAQKEGKFEFGINRKDFTLLPPLIHKYHTYHLDFFCYLLFLKKVRDHVRKMSYLFLREPCEFFVCEWLKSYSRKKSLHQFLPLIVTLPHMTSYAVTVIPIILQRSDSLRNLSSDLVCFQIIVLTVFIVWWTDRLGWTIKPVLY